MKSILFIRVNISETKSDDAMQPMVFAILDELTPETYKKKYVDDCIEEVDFSIQADIVAFTFTTYAAKRAYAFAKKFRENGSKIIMGGFHVSAMPDEALEYSDTVVIGDAEPVWQKLLNDFENNCLKDKYFVEHDSTTLKTKANREIFKDKKYFPAHLVQWGRGCIHNCDFCSIKSFYGNKSYIRTLEDVIKEVKTLDKKVIFFTDDNLYHGKELFREFLLALLPLKKQWACQISMDVTHDMELVNLMKKSGCIMALIGIESFNEDNLKLMNKSWNRNKEAYSKAISIFRKHGIMVYGTFIFGYDFDTQKSFVPVIEFAIENKLFLANFNPLYPMPGTELYERLKKQNRLEFDKWWLHPEFYYGKSMFKPMSMTPQQLEEGCFFCKKKFNSYTSIFSRMIDFKANSGSFKKLILYLAVNLINRREIYKKQFQKLGSNV